MSDTPDMRVLQINLNKNQYATENTLQLAVELKIDIIVVQEPWLIPRQPGNLDYSNTRSVHHQQFVQIFPAFPAQLRPRTMVYVMRELGNRIKLTSQSPQDPDIQILSVDDSTSNFELINIYNQLGQMGERGKTLEAYLYNYHPNSKTILLGDFNLHHPLWQPESPADISSERLVEWCENQRMELINSPGCGTFFRPHMEKSSTIDLTFASRSMVNRIIDWQVLDDLGSDHYGILFTIANTNFPTVPSESQPKFNLAKADWGKFTIALKSQIQQSKVLQRLKCNASDPQSIRLQYLQSGSHLQSQFLDQAAEDLSNAIKTAADASIPIKYFHQRSKPWWNKELKELRKEMIRKHKILKIDKDDAFCMVEYKHARNTYFSAIKSAKQGHWNNFLEKEDPRSIFQAMSYTKEATTKIIPSLSRGDGNMEVFFFFLYYNLHPI